MADPAFHERIVPGWITFKCCCNSIGSILLKTKMDGVQPLVYPKMKKI